jgi:hypothetical protein
MLEMFKQKPFPFSLIVGVILITLHYVGSYYSWYWVYPWYDVVVHVAGGLWVALLILWVANIFGQVNSLKEYKVKIFLMAFVSAVLFGIVWELVENYTNITAVDYSGYALDTALDIFSGALGGVLAYTYFVRRRKCVDNTCDVLHPFYNQTGLITR